VPNPTLTRAIDALASGRDLPQDDASAVLAEIMAGEATEIEIAGFLIALRTKGETEEELAGLAATMRRLAARVDVGGDDLLDTAGTGGGRQTFNVSTTAALIAAGAGCRVAKHGNRSATGLSGSADLLEALGVRIDLGPEDIVACIREVGFGFMFAPTHHQATRYVIPVRSGLAVRTIFNFLGPLTNPAGATRQLIGVSDPAYLERMAGALARLGARRALVVSSEDGLDEMSSSAPTHVVEVSGGDIRRYTVSVVDVGLDEADPAEVAGGTPDVNAETTRRILAGERGAPRDLAVLNAGAAIYAGGGADTLEEGVRAAERAIDDGAAAGVLERLVARTQALAGGGRSPTVYARPDAESRGQNAGLDAPRR
jgi:anthranilate phosphoribosyltransferase